MPKVGSMLLDKQDLIDKHSDFLSYLKSKNRELSDSDFPIDLENKKEFLPFIPISLIEGKESYVGNIQPDDKVFSLVRTGCKLKEVESDLLNQLYLIRTGFSLNEIKNACNKAEDLYFNPKTYHVFGDKNLIESVKSDTVSADFVKPLAREKYADLINNICEYIEKKHNFIISEDVKEDLGWFMIEDALKQLNDTPAEKELKQELETVQTALISGTNWEDFEALLQNRSIEYQKPEIQQKTDSKSLLEEYKDFLKEKSEAPQSRLEVSNLKTSNKDVSRNFIKENIENVYENAKKSATTLAKTEKYR